jgi:hypothetical protein
MNSPAKIEKLLFILAIALEGPKGLVSKKVGASAAING